MIALKIANSSHFSPKRTFECGQCFRWQEEEDGSYTGVVEGHVANISLDGSTINIDSNNLDLQFWEDYLDLKRDYAKIEKNLSKDSIMKKAISKGTGIRLLKQPLWECLLSFIISQNNNIPRIKKIVQALCVNYGNEIKFRNKTYYSFPTPEQLHNANLDPIKAGFREKYILDAVNKVINNDIDLNSIWEQNSDEAEKYLMQIKGVGNKVADCVLLFAYQKFDVFPKDVWIKRIVKDLYNIEEKEIALFASNKFKDYCGFAQQYLFFQARD